MEATLQERLAAVQRAAAAAAGRTPEAARALLAERARRLARPPHADAEGEGADTLELLVCRVGAESVALPLAAVAAVARLGPVARLPRAVAPVYGVTAWRGRPLTVLALAPRATDDGGQPRLVVLGSGARAVLAIAVDAVDDLHRVSRDTLSPARDGPRRAYTLGVTPGGLLVLDTAALLHADVPTP